MATLPSTVTPYTLFSEASAFRFVADFLDRNELEYVEREDESLFVLTLTTARASFRTFIKIAEKDEISEVTVITVYPVKIPEARRVAVAEAIQHGSFALISSVPEIDMRDGEIRLKSLLVATTAHITDKLLNFVVFGNLDMSNAFLEPLLSVGFGSASPVSVKTMLFTETAAGQVLQ